MHDDAAEAHQRKLIRHGLTVMAGFARAHPVAVTLSVIGSIAMAFGIVASTVVLGWVTDDLVLPEFSGTQADHGTLVVILAVVGVAAVRSLGVIVRRYFAGMTVFRSRNDLQSALADQYLAMSPEEIRSAPRGRLLAHADSDVEWATDMLSPMPFTIGVFTLLGVSVVSLALVDWTLTLIALAMMPAVVGLNRLNAKACERPAIAVRESVGHTSSIASESFDGALVVKTLGRERRELERFADAAADLRDNSIRLGRLQAMFSAALDLVPDVGVVAMVVLGAWRVGSGHITTGQLVQAVALFTLLQFPLRVIGYFLGEIPPSVVAHDRVVAMLSRPTVERTGTAELPAGPLGLDIDGVSVSYGAVPAVECVDLHVSPGEVVAVVGRTGCGKSSLIGAITAMVPLSAGQVRIGGEPVDSISALAMTTRTATVWQDPFLLAASVRENIEFGVSLAPEALLSATDAAQFTEVVRGLPAGLDTPIGERGVRLSGGQRQRLALARAIARRPGLLLLDDATSAVDPLVEERVLGAMRELGCTIVVVAHRRSTVALADRVVFMRDGRVAAMGDHADLLNEPQYAALLAAYDTEVGAPS